MIELNWRAYSTTSGSPGGRHDDMLSQPLGGLLLGGKAALLA